MQTQTEARTNILTARQSKRAFFYGHLLSPETLILTDIFKYSAARYFPPVLTRFWGLGGFKKKIPNIIFHRNPFSGSRADGIIAKIRTDGRT
jgi:hypothetical protein